MDHKYRHIVIQGLPRDDLPEMTNQIFIFENLVSPNLRAATVFGLKRLGWLEGRVLTPRCIAAIAQRGSHDDCCQFRDLGCLPLIGHMPSVHSKTNRSGNKFVRGCLNLRTLVCFVMFSW